MTVQDLISCLRALDQDKHIYINFEPNFEDEFRVFLSDAGNYELVPKFLVRDLMVDQEFGLEEILY